MSRLGFGEPAFFSKSAFQVVKFFRLVLAHLIFYVPRKHYPAWMNRPV
jgi:hypothetical protein